MIVHWIVDGVSGSEATGYHSALATNRYRAILPARGLRALGHQVRLVDMSSWQPQNYITGEKPDAIVIGKLLGGPRFESLKRQMAEGVQFAQRLGIKVVADINDDHFQHPVLGSHWKAMVSLADAVTAGSDSMAEVVRKYSHRPVFVVSDPVAAPQCEPHVFQRLAGWRRGLIRVLSAMGYAAPRLRLVWYGNPTNWRSMAAWVPRLTKLAKHQPWQLTIISQPGAGIESFVSGFNAASSANATMAFEPWSEEGQWPLVQDAHLVLIPADLTDSTKAVKSANRVIDALQSGRFVIASPVPAYQALADFVWLGDDPLAGIEWALANPEQALDRIKRGQAYVQAHHSLDAIARRWADVLAELPAGELHAVRLPDQAEATPRSTLPSGWRINLEDGGTTHDDYNKKIWDAYTIWFYNEKVWKNMTWHGVRTLKMPADMWNYQEIIFEHDIEHVIETGTRHGGSALFFMETLAAKKARGPVISIDIDDSSRAVRDVKGIVFLTGNSTDKSIVDQVKQLLPANRGRVFLILDSDHSRDHVLAELETWVPFLKPGDYLVVEDTNVNGHPVRPEHGPGPWEAVMQYLDRNPGLLERDIKRERKFGATAAPNGYYIRK